MSETIGAAQLAITADASGVEAGVSKAKKSLSTLGGAAKSAGADAAAGIDKIGDGGTKAAAKIDRDARSIINSIQRTTATAEAGARGSSAYFEAIAKQRGVSVDVLRPYLTQLDAATTKQAAAAAAAKATAPAIAQIGMSAKATAASLRGVPAQFTDIITSLQAGQAPLTVFLQQGGQLKDMFGGIGPAARALGGYMLGLINPLTLAAGAVAALGLAYFQGSREADGYARAIILTGNFAGKTVGQLQQMAERMSAVSGTQAAAADALAQFVANGTIAGDNIERFSALALKMEKLTGQAVSETVKHFAELGKSPVEASAKLNEQTNFLTASVASQIRMLEEQGRVVDAATVAQKAYADALEGRLPQIESRLGAVERAWLAVKGAAKGAWDTMLGLGRQDNIEQQLERVGREIEKARKPFDASNRGNTEARAQLPDNLLLQASLQEQVRLMRRGAESQAEQTAQVKAQLAFDKAGDQFITKKARMEREIVEARNQGIAAGKTQIEIERRVADIREKYADKGAGRAASRLAKADMALEIEKINTEAEKLVGIYASSEKRIDALRSIGIISEREYYEAKRGFINLNAAAEEDRLKRVLAQLREEKLAGADKLTNDRKIADTEGKLAILRADTSAKLTENSEAQVQATRKEAAAFLSAQQAAENYYGAMSRSQDREFAGLGKGNRARSIDQGRSAIEDRARQAREQLQNELALQKLMQGGTVNDDQQRRFDERMALLAQYEAKELASWTAHTDRMLGAEQNWLTGAQEGLRNYADQTKNVAGEVEQIFGKAFSSLEDAIVQFAETGKISVSGLVRSIVSDLVRLQARKVTGALAQSLAGAIGGASGPSGGDGGGFFAALNGQRAIGGPVSPGGLYEVNERGPELLNVGGKQFLMMGQQGGSVAPGGGKTTIVNQTQGRVDNVVEETAGDGSRVMWLQQAQKMYEADAANPTSRLSRNLRSAHDLRRKF